MRSVALALAVATTCVSARAEGKYENASSPIFSFRGFGTVGLVHSSDHKSDFINNDLQNTAPATVKAGAGMWTAVLAVKRMRASRHRLQA